MCQIINFNEYRRFKGARKAEHKQTTICAEKRNTGGLSTEALVKEFVQNGKSVLKLILYIIEQYGCLRSTDRIFEAVKRDMKYCEICPEIENKRLKAPLAVKIKGEWYAVEVITNSSSKRAFYKKWDTIGNYNVNGFRVNMDELGYRDEKWLLDMKDNEYYWKDIVEKVHDAYFNGPIVRPFNREVCVRIHGEDTRINCIYKMKELSLYDYVILEGTEVKTGNQHMLLLYKVYKGSQPKEYADYCRGKYADAGIPLFYAKWHYEDWKSDMMTNIRDIYRSLEELLK